MSKIIIRLMLRGIHGLEFFFEVSKYYFLYPFAKVKYRNKNIWVVCERGTDARDNGYHFFRYMREEHPEQDTYYIIDAHSADYHKVSSYGNIIQYHSVQHYMIYAGAKMKISTHDCGCAPNRWWYSKLEKRKMIPGKFVFLQHGITKDDMVSLHRENTGIDLFICGARTEYDYVVQHFGYKKEQVKYTGFARYDNLLLTEVKEQILVMPTWRIDLSNKSNKQIQNSQYVNKWNEFLHNPQLGRILRKNGIKLIFYPHYEMQKHLNMFTCENHDIEIASFNDYDVQKLLKESKLLVTDYSSVFFDFSYMHKPVIYYQFDDNYYRKTHYKQGYFRYETMGFGPVENEIDDVIKSIEKYVACNYSCEKTYQLRLNTFFEYHDSNNCNRIYNQMMEL